MTTAPPPRVIDPNASLFDKPRLTGQNAVILDMLQRGSRTNKQLATVSLKYTSRISDLRAAGYTIRCVPVHNGTTLYTLITNG